MCHMCTGEDYDRPIVKADVDIIKKFYSQVNPEIVDELFEAITDHHTPQPAALVALVELFFRGKQKDKGMYDWPVIPFSALILDDLHRWDRLQTKEMVAFHSVFESMALAQRNVQLINKIFNKYELQFILFCDCGCGAPELSFDVFNSEVYKGINAIRSEIEALGTEVTIVSSFDDPLWENRQLDMQESEVASYKRMWEVLSILPAATFTKHSISAQKGMEILFNLSLSEKVV